jgi:hypothetical protein
MKEIEHHGNLCTWHDDADVRCKAPGIIGSTKRCLCAAHHDLHMKTQLDPEAYANWRAAMDAK